ncbi:MAG: anhydro-N-acetylmuramic acid kinase [Bacteroidales bacterium]|nr:anhydro-N-acetylmuramic acid kinase [Bacteroidales bacterium]MDT8431715.1 anhydro-N-acetylmuramic acid kinase [Bacteroidales bacterium]
MYDLKEFVVLGLMSGTSLDGVDLALCRFTEAGGAFQYHLIGAETITYPRYMKEKLDDAFNISAAGLQDIDQELGAFYAEQILGFLDRHHPRPLLIASHGHTIRHQPDKGITMQIGDGTIIAKKTGITVINDFRTQDVSKGGQGAPLVPVGDRDLFGDYRYCLNLGGIANVSFDDKGIRIACDIAPCNMALNTITSWIDMEYDWNGALAARGEVQPDLLERLNALAYYRLPAPKSLGKEWFLRTFLPEIRQTEITIEDLLRTVNEHIADQVASFININHPDGSSMLITGGGVHNRFLVSLLKNKCQADLFIPGEKLIDFKEAIVFAYLGLLRQLGNTNVLASVTGADSDTCAGIIHHPN